MAIVAPIIEPHPGFIEEIDYDELDFRDQVGKGSFGVVYMAIWRNSRVAVKMIESESERRAFVTELRQLSRVSHPNIIRLYGACRNPVSLVMEYAECGSLYSLLHGPGPQPHYTSGHGMSWCLQCATGVAYLHGMKPKALIHRDLKPPNLLLTNNGVVLKICDFGTACDQHTHMTNNKGSAAWMAPEVFEGCQYSEKCDVFSWGIILWEVLTRKKPFDELGGPAFRIMWAVHTGTRPSLIQGCPKPVEQLMTRCWSAKPNERPSMNEVVEAMIDLMMFFPGGDDPLNFPSHDTDSGSEDGYACESVSESEREIHMGTISETIRKSHQLNKSYSKSGLGPHSPGPNVFRHQDVVDVARGRPRSYTPDPPKPAPDPTRHLFKKGHRRASSYGNKLDIPYDALRNGALADVSKTGRTRRSSADLIAELEQQPLEPPKTPIGSRSVSPAPGKPGRRTNNVSGSPISFANHHNTPPIASKPSPAYISQPKTPPSFTDLKPQMSQDSDSQCDSLPKAYITLELHLQPLPPSTSSRESMEIHQKHCVLAEKYLKVLTEIALLKARGEQLRHELEQDEKAKMQGNQLLLEYEQLVNENTSLQKWYDNMKKDLARVRENRNKWT
ncbi:mitogen-activated protein kinase kinase kinase 7-like isoform X2 [Clavelina lepadiformis]|uniref:mitogen-activated protein kinase kinase kinase 7-like isoform X2 n=1 Tax=Clavelina lepadiformis TaxID=159417 RepID=UPI004042E43A